MSLSVMAILRDTNSFIRQNRRLAGVILLVLILQISLGGLIHYLGLTMGGALIRTFIEAGLMGVLVQRGFDKSRPLFQSFMEPLKKHFAKIIILAVIAEVIETLTTTSTGGTSLQTVIAALLAVVASGWVLFALYEIVAKDSSSEEAIQRGASAYFKNILPIAIARAIVTLLPVLPALGWAMYISSYTLGLLAGPGFENTDVQRMTVMTYTVLPILALFTATASAYLFLMSYQLSKKLLP